VVKELGAGWEGGRHGELVALRGLAM